MIRALTKRFVRFALASSLGIGVTGCHSPQHKMADTPAGTKIACQQCYDEMKVVSGGGSKQSMGGTS